VSSCPGWRGRLTAWTTAITLVDEETGLLLESWPVEE
jgi:hypothetical protein